MNGHVKELILASIRAAISLVVVGATVAFIWSSKTIPEPWWPAMVAVLSYLYQAGSRQTP